VVDSRVLVYRRHVRRVLWLLLVLGACEADNPRNCEDGVCSDPAFPVCDSDGAIGGNPHTCVPAACEAGRIIGCQGSGLYWCNADGTAYETIACAGGCDATLKRCNDCVPDTANCSGNLLERCGSSGTVEHSETCKLACSTTGVAHCEHLVPRYAPDICDADATTADYTLTSSGTVDTSLDNNCNGGVISQTGGPALCVLHYGTVSIPMGKTLKVTGTRSFALVADHDLMVAGVIDVSADRGTNGPGGGATLSGASFYLTTAGGGAGFHTAGGNGGNATTDGGGGMGGMAMQNPSALVALTGGPQSGATSGGIKGGGGGGSLALVSCRGTVTVTGVLDAGGGGGQGGALSTGGRGGGGGGYIVIQGAGVGITGEIYANGGGGGAGQSPAIAGVDGEDGSRSATVAAAGGASVSGSGQGGAGGLGLAPGGIGLRPTMANATAGGGGGSVGFLQTYTPQGVTPTLMPSSVSPPLEPNGTVPTR